MRAPGRSLFFVWLMSLFLAALPGCHSLDSPGLDEYEEAPAGAAVQERDIAEAQKPAPVFDRSNFEFLSEKMKKVVRNYKRMKKKLSRIEKKLDVFLAEFRRARDEIFAADEGADEGGEAIDSSFGDDILNEAMEKIPSSGGEDDTDLAAETVSPDSRLFTEEPFLAETESAALRKIASP